MSDHFYLVGHRRLDAATVKACEAIAERHDGTFEHVHLPDGWRTWFACDNRGAPFDQRFDNAVGADLDAAGLVEDGRVVADLRRVKVNPHTWDGRDPGLA